MSAWSSSRLVAREVYQPVEQLVDSTALSTSKELHVGAGRFWASCPSLCWQVPTRVVFVRWECISFAIDSLDVRRFGEELAVKISM